MRPAVARRAERHKAALTVSTAELPGKALTDLSRTRTLERRSKFLDLSLKRPQEPVLHPLQVDQSELQSLPAPWQAAGLYRSRLSVGRHPSLLRSRPAQRVH